MTDELKPCPMCAASLSKASVSGYHHHPMNDCIFSGFEISRDDVAAWSRRAPAEVQVEKDAKAAELGKMLANIIHDQTVAMQSAIIEWQHGKGAEAGLQWIVNTIDGPGHLPDFDAPFGKQAQFWFDANRAEPFPTCFCGNPSHQLWMGQGFCCNEHYAEAKAKHDALAAPAASGGDRS